MLTYSVNIHHGPGPLLALLPEPDPVIVASTAVALTNTDGGAIMVGLDGNGSYTGPLDAVDTQRAMQHAGELCNPYLDLAGDTYHVTPDSSAVLVHVARGARVHALQDGQVLVRAAHTNRALTGDEIRRLLSSKSSGDFEAEIVPGAKPRDLSPEQVADFMLRYAGGVPAAPEPDDLLLHIGAITSDYHVTVAGMLLFGKDPQRWMPHSGIRFVRLLDHDGAHMAFEHQIGGAAVPLIETTWERIQEQLRTDALGQAPHAGTYPAAVVREALVNAVCHRDYRLRSECITISLFPDRLEISSPGGLPGFLTTQHLLGGRYSRNPCLSWSLLQWGYITVPGQGMFEMVTGMDRHGYRPPEIIAEPYRMMIRLYNAHRPPETPGPAEATQRLNERQRIALAHVHSKGSITLHELQALCPTQPLALLQQDLSDLVTEDYLRNMWRRNGAYYIFP